ncbi:single-stranded-DNA-specific exonuclease RecJ [Albibacterium sp.]|uniref:single-stranded-DNA-specific exonuclease RecJ n=1 Tax=Albibacterium sp. TaxID=2952885 RepID=UPI002BD6EB23|nr:single-stranded-DNA-specific exonuclease RecJ [Albibacterium sp.]HUH17604.1 single-stranded-DNA-specific exonuclease RecJ [Albibacterium sp.]
MQKRWVEQALLYPEKVEELCKSLGISRVLARLLTKREIHSYQDAEHFFCPELNHLHDPFLMKDMDKAILRIEKALENNEKILIYGDYDVDGTTAVALVYSFFREFYNRIDFYIPDRYAEGYGISTAGVDYAHEHGFSLIIALDCGIKSMDKVSYAHSKQIDFIIADHHNPSDTLPDAAAVLDPKRIDCNYPFKELSGAGIGFKLIQAFSQRNSISDEKVYCYLDLVAVSIASDIVPIVGENRVLTHYGLKKFNSNPCVGLEALIALSRNKEVFSVRDLVFQIGPRINAAGRIKHARDAVFLLVSRSAEEARQFSEQIDIQNSQRKDFDSQITEEALAMIDESEEFRQRKTTVVYKQDWHKGVIGIVASRLTEKYYRPTVVLTRSNGMVAGSARSVLGYDLYEALNQCSELFEQFGGHKYAAGLSMLEENVSAFQTRFEEIVSANIPMQLLTPELLIHEVLELKEIGGKFFRILKRFAPFGPQNESPLFLSKGVNLVGYASIVGKGHLKMRVVQGASSAFECIGFGLAEMYSLVSDGLPFDICYSIEENVWRDRREIQLNIKGIKMAEYSTESVN